MARRSMSVYLNSCYEENRVRTFGGNGSDVRVMVDEYRNMTKEQFLLRHPRFANKCKDGFKLIVFYN